MELSNPVYSWRDGSNMQYNSYSPYSGGISAEQMQMHLLQGQMHQADFRSYHIFIRKAVESSEEETLPENQKRE